MVGWGDEGLAAPVTPLCLRLKCADVPTSPPLWCQCTQFELVVQGECGSDQTKRRFLSVFTHRFVRQPEKRVLWVPFVWCIPCQEFVHEYVTSGDLQRSICADTEIANMMLSSTTLQHFGKSSNKHKHRPTTHNSFGCHRRLHPPKIRSSSRHRFR